MKKSDYSLLPHDRTFRDSLPAFLLPYVLYGLVDLIPTESGQSLWLNQVIKFMVIGAAILWFSAKGYYKVGFPSSRDLSLSLLFAPLAIALWCLPLIRTFTGIPEQIGLDLPGVYFWFRVLNSVLLVAFFEEMAIRGWVQEWVHTGIQKGQWSKTLPEQLHKKPHLLPAPPLGKAAVMVAGVLFILGHPPLEYISAFLYFSFTTWVYFKTRSFWILILMHAITNAALAFFVGFMGWTILWRLPLQAFQ